MNLSPTNLGVSKVPHDFLTPAVLAASEDLNAKMNAASAATGNRLIYVFRTLNANRDQTSSPVWASISSGTGIGATMTGLPITEDRDTMVAAAQVMISNSGNAELIIIE